MTLIAFPLPAVPPTPVAPASSGGSAGSTGSTGAPAADTESEDAVEGGSEQTDFAALLATFVAPLVEPAPIVNASAPVVAGPEVAVPVAPAIVATIAAMPTITLPVTPTPVAEIAPEIAAVVATAVELAPDAPVEVAEAIVDAELTDVDVPSTVATATVVAEQVDAAPEPQVAVDAPAPEADAPDAEPVDADATTKQAPSIVAEAKAAPVLVDALEAPTPSADDDVTPVRSEGATVTTLRSATTPIAPASEPAPVRPAVHTPIVTAVVPLAQRGDGSYHVAVRLHPEELGAVDIDVELRGGEINLRLRADNDAGREAIRAALPLLRSELEAAGVRAGTFDLGDHPSGQAPEERRQPMPAPRAEPLPDSTESPDDVVSDTALDVRL